MGDLVFMLHSGLRYLVFVTALLAIAALVLSRPAGAENTMGRVVYGAFVGLLDLQVLAGLITLATRGFYPQLMGHITMMVLALIVAHGVSIAHRRRPPERRSARLLVGGVVVSLVLVVGGILAIGRPII